LKSNGLRIGKHRLAYGRSLAIKYTEKIIKCRISLTADSLAYGIVINADEWQVQYDRL